MPISIPRKLSRWAVRTALSGAAASALSSVVVALCSTRETGRPSAGVNAASQWIWGPRAKRRLAPSWRYTAVGYAIHHASSMLWAGVYEYWCRRAPARGVAGQVGRAAAVAALACTVDYTITPRRFRPGFERHLGRPSMAMVYASFAIGLLVTQACREPRRARRVHAIQSQNG